MVLFTCRLGGTYGANRIYDFGYKQDTPPEFLAVGLLSINCLVLKKFTVFEIIPLCICDIHSTP